MKFSLIMGTLGRLDEVRRFIDSLIAQTYQDFELIVVDQNSGTIIRDLCAEYETKITIRYLHTDKAGLSHARNLGLRAVTGDVIAFPDDDCEYPETLLASIHDLLAAKNELDGIIGMLKEKGTSLPSCGRYTLDTVTLTPKTIWRRHISCGMFYRKRAIDAIGDFDEAFGVGTYFGAGEETDYLLRGLYKNLRILYTSEIWAYHPHPTVVYDHKASTRAYNYGLGFGALFKKHLVRHKEYTLLTELVRHIVRTLVGAILFAMTNPGRSRYYRLHLSGWVKGFIKYS